MIELEPLDTLHDAGRGNNLPLPVEFARLYGPLRFPPHSQRPYAIGNFVSTLDGAVSLKEAGCAGGGDISGLNAQPAPEVELSCEPKQHRGAFAVHALPALCWSA